MLLYTKYISIHFRSQMQYKTSFFLTIIGQFLVSFTVLLGLYFMMNRFHSVDNFSLPEVLLCFATVLMAYSLAECFARGFDQFPQMISNCELDRVLVRPRSVVFQVLAGKVEFTRLGRLTQAVLVFCYAIPASGVDWSWDKIITLILMIACGMIVFFGLFLVYAAVSVFTIEGIEFMNVLTDGGREFGTYPFSIYGEGILKFLTYIIPLALFQYYPLLYLLGIEDNPVYMFMPLMSLLFLIPCFAFWRFGLHRYKSTGS
ncbi:MAG: ABC-2 family transporter protein [Oscillospiraceae bacterium]|nr:ABC-2 family transporter protein [Oscillospiraceae bacterium]